MALRERAGRDYQRLVNRKTGGFGYDITITAPDGAAQPLVGYSNDISAVIDPDTGQVVAGRVASVAVSILDLDGFVIPDDIPDQLGKPWRVAFDDIAGQPYEFKVRQAMPDRAIGSIVLVLEAYSP